MVTTIDAIRAEYLRYKTMAERAFAQTDDADLSRRGGVEDNSIAVICWHISGNLESRFTDFLSGDGEKPWRNRDDEFALRTVTRAELLEKWQRGWTPLFATLSSLSDEDLQKTILIRRQPLQVNEALMRSLAHLSYHVGQIVFIAKSLGGSRWKSLSIPRGGSEAYNHTPTSEHARAHAEKLAHRE